MPRFYRVVRAKPPTERDFFSRAQLGMQPPRGGDESLLRQHAGVSVLDTEAAARASAQKYPGQGEYIAVLGIPERTPLEYRKTGGSGHYTLSGEPAAMLTAVTSVVDVNQPSRAKPAP